MKLRGRTFLKTILSWGIAASMVMGMTVGAAPVMAETYDISDISNDDILSLIDSEPAEYNGADALNGVASAENAVLYFIPHQDDEILTFGSAILKDLRDGKDVHVILVSEGKGSFVLTDLNNGGFPLSEAEFVKTRDEEFCRALTEFGVPLENIHIPRNRASNEVIEYHNLLVKNIMLSYLAQYPGASVCVTSTIADHREHAAIGQLAAELYRDGIIASLYMYLDPQAREREGEVAGLFEVAIDEDDIEKFDRACFAYEEFDPDRGLYGVGYHSVPELFRIVEDNPNCYGFACPSSTVVRYGGNDRYATAVNAANGITLEGVSPVNFKGVSAEMAPTAVTDDPETEPGDDTETVPGDDDEKTGEDGDASGEDGGISGDDGETSGDVGSTGDDDKTPDDGTAGDEGGTPDDGDQTPEGDEGGTPDDGDETPEGGDPAPGDDDPEIPEEPKLERVAVDSDNIQITHDKIYAPHLGKGTTAENHGDSENVGGTLVLANGKVFPDALAASSLGYEIMLTRPTSLSAEARAEILRTLPSRIIIMGGEGAIERSVEKTIRNLAKNVTIPEKRRLTQGLVTDVSSYSLVYQPTIVRLGGLKRTDTADAVASFEMSLGLSSTTDTLIVTTGKGYADAVSIAPYAARTGSPIFLTGSSGLTENSLKVIKKLHYSRVIIVGGPGVVPTSVEKQLKPYVQEIIRIYGKNRYETSLEIARFEIEEGMSIANFSLATGENFPDALVAGPITANNNSVIFLVSPNRTKWESTRRFIAENIEPVRENGGGFCIFGAPGAVSQLVPEYIHALLN